MTAMSDATTIAVLDSLLVGPTLYLGCSTAEPQADFSNLYEVSDVDGYARVAVTGLWTAATGIGVSTTNAIIDVLNMPTVSLVPWVFITSDATYGVDTFLFKIELDNPFTGVTTGDTLSFPIGSLIITGAG
jgi:hypothetical protein